MASFVSGCLITNPVEFEQEEPVPPVILDVARSSNPIGSILEVNVDEQPSRIEIPVRVSDANLFQDLVARSRLVTALVDEPEFDSVVIPEQGALLRDHVVFVEAGELSLGGCHQLELVVSGSFVPGEEPDLFDVVSVAGDVARATWTIWEVSDDPTGDNGATAAHQLVRSCPTRDALVIEGMEPAP